MHKIGRKSIFDKQHTVHIAPKPKKVEQQMEVIHRKRTLEMQLSRSSLAVGDCTDSPTIGSVRSNSLSVGGATFRGGHMSLGSQSLDGGDVAAHSLQSILADDRLLDLFAKHLCKEFGVECLCAVVEMQQFKSYLKEQLKVEWDVQIVEFSPNVPRSSLVYKVRFR